MVRERWESEQEFWDRVAGKGLAAANEVAGWRWVYDELLDDVEAKPGAHLLDCGCGSGAIARLAAERGAEVAGFDISHGQLVKAKEHSEGIDAVFVASGFEQLPFKDESFDSAVGMFILHHVDRERSLAELRRVLKPGAQAAFYETWQKNPLLRFARKLRGRFGIAMYGMPEERPLMPTDLEHFRRAGFRVTVEYPSFVFFSLAANNLFRRKRFFRPMIRTLEALDRWLWRVKRLRPYTYYAVIKLGSV